MERFLKNSNTVLTIIILILAFYLIMFPFLPGFLLWVEDARDSTKGYIYNSNLTDEIDTGIDKLALKPTPDDNRIVIPTISIDGEIHEGDSPAVLKEGIWRRPNTSTPDKGGNTVIISHRRMYTFNPDVFYSLPKLEKDDKFIVFWEGKEYDYQVFETKTVDPSETEIEENTNEAIVTLYTCTLNSKQRIVVRGRKI